MQLAFQRFFTIQKFFSLNQVYFSFIITLVSEWITNPRNPVDPRNFFTHPFDLPTRPTYPWTHQRHLRIPELIHPASTKPKNLHTQPTQFSRLWFVYAIKFHKSSSHISWPRHAKKLVPVPLGFFTEFTLYRTFVRKIEFSLKSVIIIAVVICLDFNETN